MGAETAVPYTQFKRAGFYVQFATENGKAPECDRKLYQGVTQKLLVPYLHRVFRSKFCIMAAKHYRLIIYRAQSRQSWSNTTR